VFYFFQFVLLLFGSVIWVTVRVLCVVVLSRFRLHIYSSFLFCFMRLIVFHLLPFVFLLFQLSGLRLEFGVLLFHACYICFCLFSCIIVMLNYCMFYYLTHL
jgi:hypothetical protein